MVLAINTQERYLKTGKDPEKEIQTIGQEISTDSYYGIDKCSLNIPCASLHFPDFPVVKLEP